MTKFKMKFDLEVNVLDWESGGMERTCEALSKINRFVEEFFKHPEVVTRYYSSYFLDQYINSSNNDWNLLAKHLRYKADFGPLFIEIAKNCEAEVASFIEGLFAPDTDNKEANIQKEIDCNLLHERLDQLKIIDAQFVNS